MSNNETQKSLKPPNPRHLDEARKAGIKLIRRSTTDPNGNIYECPKCRTELALRADLVRNKLNRQDLGSWPCENCKWKKYKSDAENANLEIIKKAENTHNLIYKFKECGHQQEIAKHEVSTEQFQCRECLEIKLEKEANLKNLTIVGKNSDTGMRIYKFLSCGHQSELRISSIRNSIKRNNKPHKCWACHNEKLAREASEAGLLLYGERSGRGKNKWYLYQADCGHSIERRADQIKIGDWRCQACIDTKLSNEAEKAGLRLLGKGKDKAFRTYEFIDCGHVKEISTDSVRNNTFHCDVCFWDDKHNTLEKRGLRIIGSGSKGDNRIFEFIECGHIKEISLQSALDGSFVCHECDETWYSLPSNLYLLKIKVGDEEWLKLGVAKVLETRIKQYGLPKIAVIDVLKILPTITGQEALEKESSIYHQFKSSRLGQDEMKQWHRYSGYTECYPVSLTEKFMSLFDTFVRH